MNVPHIDNWTGVYRDGVVHLDAPPGWEDGARVSVSNRTDGGKVPIDGHVIIVGFGLAGRSVADLLQHAEIPFTIIEKNAVTVETQQALGRSIIQGDASESSALAEAGLQDAAILALTIPDEDAVLQATSIARRLRPSIYIIARTNYSSKGMRASQLGADCVINAEQAVALQFYDHLSRRIGLPIAASSV